ncbi:helix-turn-helix domain-containing protein [Streptomyces sp. URMC 129]|uniref:helix-turn-helix domain-containing protein n=1 Tax=Streptomyces sp. URMC 129 TaxID=3423407 RepID=UPI003F1C9621
MSRQPLTRCRRGHDLSGDGTVSTGRNGRMCRQCAALRSQRYYAEEYARQHPGHTVITDAAGRRYCVTCRSEHRPRPAVEPDPIAVDRAIAGDPPASLLPAERAAAVAALRAADLTGRQIATRLGCAERTVWRTLARARQTSGSRA